MSNDIKTGEQTAVKQISIIDEEKCKAAQKAVSAVEENVYQSLAYLQTEDNYKYTVDTNYHDILITIRNKHTFGGIGNEVLTTILGNLDNVKTHSVYWIECKGKSLIIRLI